MRGKAVDAMRRATAIVLAFLVALPSTSSFADGAWLDRPLTAWNQSAMAIPVAPDSGPVINPMCLRDEVAAATPMEIALTSARWRLVRTREAASGTTTVILATAEYDGMCRPAGFNAFAFVDGVFAGTLSPIPMVSRLDGTLAGPDSIASTVEGRLSARFLRYSPSDPLCCPSLPSISVEYRVDRTATGPVVVPVASRRAERSDAPVARLPRSGEIGLQELLGLGLGLVVIGAAIRVAIRFRKGSPPGE